MTQVLVKVPQKNRICRFYNMCGLIGVYPSLSGVFKCWNIFINVMRYAMEMELKSEHTVQFYFIDTLCVWLQSNFI